MCGRCSSYCGRLSRYAFYQRNFQYNFKGELTTQTLELERYLRTDFYTLHLLARRIIISKELLEVANLVVECLANESKVFHEQQKNISTETYFPIQRRLIAFGGEIKTLEKRLGSIHERLKNEITLVSIGPT